MTIYRNAHWQVVEDGVETVDPLPPYDFAIDRVFETTKRGNATYYDWPVHMAEKTWVDVALFNDAFERAIRHYSGLSGEPIDEDMLHASFGEAFRIEARRNA